MALLAEMSVLFFFFLMGDYLKGKFRHLFFVISFSLTNKIYTTLSLRHAKKYNILE